MPRIGFSKLKYARYAASNGAVTYSAGGTLGRAVSVTITPNSNDPVKFYADNALAETANVFSDGTLQLGIAELDADVAAAVLGATKNTNSGTVVEYSANDVAPYIGLGGILKRQVNNEIGWQAVVLRKAQLRQPAIAQETQGETVVFTTPTIDGVFMRDDTNAALWRKDAFFATEAAAETWLNGELNIT